MNDKTKQLIDWDKQYLWHPFTQMQGWLESEPVIIESGKGFRVIDTQGNVYIDGNSSLWCNVHGHQVPKVDQAIRDQLGKIGHSTLLGLAQTKAIELAKRLVEITPEGLNKVFYSDAGATAVEIALKMAYQYYYNTGQTERTKFIAMRNSYHGDTIGSVSVGGIGLFHSIFRSLLFEVEFVDTPFPYRYDGTAEQCCQASLNQMEDILKENAGKVAGVVIEPLVQGAAGMIMHPAGFLKGVRELTKKYDVMMIADEVAVGFGRTGKMFACEHEDVQPDLMSVAKGISAGYLPLAATMATDKIYEGFLGGVEECKTFYHGHTYTGNALGCAAALASLDLFEENKIIENMPEKIELMNEWFEKMLELPYIGNVRQRGLMGGVEIVKNKETKESFDSGLTIGAKLCLAMRSRGAMMRPIGDVIIFMPAPGIDSETLEELLTISYEAMRDDLPNLIESE